MAQPPKGGTTVRCGKGHAVTTLSARSQIGVGSLRSFTCPECSEVVRVKVKEASDG
jgi:hypothetical protein